jgi:hypothetical protein
MSINSTKDKAIGNDKYTWHYFLKVDHGTRNELTWMGVPDKIKR